MARFLGGLLVLSGMVVMAWNLWHTAADARAGMIKPILVPAPEAIPEPVPDQFPAPLPAQGLSRWACKYKHWEKLEKNAGLLAVLIAIMVSFGGLAEIMPLFNDAQTVKPAPGVKPYERAAPGGQGCLCARGLLPVPFADDPHAALRNAALRQHSPMPVNSCTTARSSGVRSARGRTWRASAANIPTPGSALHLLAPRKLVPESNMPNYPWLAEAQIDGDDMQARMRALRMLGDPYSDAEIAGAPDAVHDKTELDALVAYLQGLGVAARSGRRRAVIAMSELWGHLIGVMIVLMHAGVHRHLDLGLAAASQECVRRPGAAAAATRMRSASHERLLVRLGDGPGLCDRRHQPVPVRVGHHDAHPHRRRWHHRPRVGAWRTARRQCDRCRCGGW